jgi:dipeptidase D
MNIYQGLEPGHVWQHFAAFNRIPRASGEEAAARSYVRQVARAADVSSEADARGNLITRVPARGGGSAAAPTVAIQAHLDMVCEKRPGVEHNFKTDPILPRRVGDCIYATGTTLGADNGMGAAMALALLTQPGLRHGPLEIIFTVEEETGLHGAMALSPDWISADMLINLDSEDPDELTIGCAGGAGTVLDLPVFWEAVPEGWQVSEVVVSGLQGGHSGVQIHEPRANAIKILTQALLAVEQSGIEFRLVSIEGGSAHNAIPRDARARLVSAPGALARMKSVIDAVRKLLRSQWEADEPGLSLELHALDMHDALPGKVLAPAVHKSLLHLLDVLPHGVLKMSETFPGKVETSSNLSGVETQDDHIEIATSSRSFRAGELQTVQEQIQALGLQAGAKVEVRDGYPGWEPDSGSRLLQVASAAYEVVYEKPARVEVVHAGLECGVIVSKKPGLEAISFGPLIRGAHSPEEHIFIPTVEPSWNLLITLLAALS